MSVFRLSKNQELNKYFSELEGMGLINYASRGYKKWHWQYTQNPFCLSPELPSWIYAWDCKAIGHLGVIPVDLKVGVQKIKAAWLVDFMTLAEYRRKGAGRELVDEVDKQFDVLLAVGATEMSFNFFLKMGWEFLGNVPYYLKIWDAKPLVRKRIKNKFLAQFVSLQVNFIVKIFNFLKACNYPQRIEISRIDNFTQEADLFWRQIVDSYKIIVPRNEDYLHWKFDLQPDMQYVKFRAARDGMVCGYAVARCIINESGSMEGLIAEVIARPQDRVAARQLVFEALKYLRSQGCFMARCFAVSPDIQKALLSCGFLRHNVKMRFLIKRNKEGLQEACKLDNWYITAGDSDMDR